MNNITGGQVLLRVLACLNVVTIFCMPGIHNLAVYTVLSDSSIHYVTVRHDQEAGFMAGGYARCTGKMGFALAISGPGLTNIFTPMVEVYQDAVPLLVIYSHIPSRCLRGHTGNIQELAQSRSMVQSIAKEVLI